MKDYQGWHLFLVFALFLMASLALRLPLISSGVFYADDWGSDLIMARLGSYRPTGAFHAWILTLLLGDQPLTSHWVQISSAGFYAVSLTLLMRVCSRFGISILLYLMVGTVVLLHPAFNQLILWSVMSGLAFCTMLCSAGVALFYLSPVSTRRWCGIGLVCLGASGHQFLSIFGASMVLIEVVQMHNNGAPSLNRKSLILRLCLIFAPVVAALASIVILRFGFGFEDFASRTVALAPTSAREYFADKFFVFSNAFANIYQAPIGLLLGTEAALKAFVPMLVLPPVVLLGCLSFRTGFTRALTLTMLMPALFVLAFSPTLVTNATPTGYRMLGTFLLTSTVGVSVVFGTFWRSRSLRSMVAILIFVVGVLFTLTSVRDANLRNDIWHQDIKWLTELDSLLKTHQRPTVKLCAYRYQALKEDSINDTGILVNYNLTGVHSYSVWYTQFLGGFLRHHGISAIDALNNSTTELCDLACAGGGGFEVASMRLVADSDGQSAVLCRK